jgi:hypothetical protein
VNPTGTHGDRARDTNLGATITLQAFRSTTSELTAEERERIVDQALVLIEQFYVHLPLKRAMHAVDPVQRLKLLKYRLRTPSERRFHDEMISILMELRDLHTNYLLPAPFASMTASLPLQIGEFFADGERQYLVTEVISGRIDEPQFEPGEAVPDPALADVSTFPDKLQLRTVSTPHGEFGYIRIRSFAVGSTGIGEVDA